MTNSLDDEYILIAKRCPDCGALLAAKMIKSSKGIEKITERICLTCGWVSPLNRN